MIILYEILKYILEEIGFNLGYTSNFKSNNEEWLTMLKIPNVINEIRSISRKHHYTNMLN